MMLYKNTKVKIHSLDGDTDFYDIVAGVLQEDTLAPISVHNLPRTLIDLMKKMALH